MFVSTLLRPKSILALILTFAIASVAYGFAAANTFAVIGAGDGTEDVSGYAIGALTYTFDTTDDELIKSVSFTVTPLTGGPAATDVRVWLGAVEADTVSNTSGNIWAATMTAAVTITDFDEMRVIAYNQAP